MGGFACTVEAEYLLRTGWARELRPRAVLRERVTVTVAGATGATFDLHARGTGSPPRSTRRSGPAWPPARSSRPRSGYAASLACERCRTPARCATCAGPLALTGPTTPPACRWCGTVEEAWACRECGHRGLRAPVLGDVRTAEELGRSFPRTRVRTSSGDRILADVDDAPAVVVATPGAEPVAAGGYARWSCWTPG